MEEVKEVPGRREMGMRGVRRVFGQGEGWSVIGRGF
jgi:hypothetical protein